MAETEHLASALRDLPFRIQSASLRERKDVVDGLICVLSHPGITEGVIKGICKVIPLALHRYRDSFSKSLIRELVVEMLHFHPCWTMRALVATLSDIAAQFKNIVVTLSVSNTALASLNWSCILLTQGWNANQEAFSNQLASLAETQAILLTAVISAGSEKQNGKALRLLHRAFLRAPQCEIAYLNTLKQLEPAQCVVVLGSALLQNFATTTNQTLENEWANYFLDVFVRTFLSCKRKPLRPIVKACYPLLRRVTHAQFKTVLLPAIQKAMLRNPEIITECVGLVVCGVSLDLSEYASDIGRSLISNVHAKDDTVRNEAVDACKHLVRRCGESGAVENLLKQVFAVFHGSDGKLTVLDHKMSVLEVAGNFSYNTVSATSREPLITVAIEYFVKVLQVEVHERILCHTLDMLSLWTCKLSGTMPTKFIEAIKNGMNLKTSTSPVRTAYINCIASSFTANNILQAAPLVPLLQKIIDKAVAQPTQVLLVTEALYAANFLLKVAAADGADKFTAFYNILLDMDKQLFLSEKFLMGASNNCLIQVMYLCERLMVDYPERINDKAGPFYRAVLTCLTIPIYEVRVKCTIVAKKMVNGLGGTQLARTLLNAFNHFLDNVKLRSKGESNSKSEQTESNNEVSSHALVECVLALCSGTNLTVDESHLLLLDALFPTHHSAIVLLVPNLWTKILKRHKLQGDKFVVKNLPYLKKVLVDEYQATAAYESALATIVSLNGPALVPYVAEIVQGHLENNSISHITKDEYFTYLTPEGELYDKSVLPGEQDSVEMNLKRESKAYSYKDQLEEQQLRRELMEKKIKEGKLKPPQYSAKQLEAIKNQRLKEQGIRDRLTHMNTIIGTSVSLIRAAVSGASTVLSLHFKDLIPCMLRNVQSPLAAPHFTKLFVELQRTLFHGEHAYLGELIARTTLRLLKPQCDLDPTWDTEDLHLAVPRIIALISNITVVKFNTAFVKQRARDFCFTAPCFAYCFSLLRAALLDAEFADDDQLVHDGLQIISEHAKLRGVNGDGGGGGGGSNIDLYHPIYLPRRQMFEMLIALIGATCGRVQSQAEACLLDVAASGSGEEHCATATLPEIDVLLMALQNPNDLVRDSALRALTIMCAAIPSFADDYESALRVSRRVWIAKFDTNEANRALAMELWSKATLSFPAQMSEQLLEDIEHPVDAVQTAAAEALAALLANDTQQVRPILDQLLELYKSKLRMIPATIDEFGREIEKPIDVWGTRRGVAVALTYLTPLLQPADIGPLIQFFVSSGLGDRSEVVRREMLRAALCLIDQHGKDRVAELLPVFEQFLDRSSKSAQFDAVKQAVVVLMGTLAKHLDRDDARIKPIVVRLIAALSTPSQTVQEAVANCLPPLVPSVKDDAPGFVNKLLHQLLKSDKYGDRKGAAYGLAGLVKGMGILALKQLDIMTKLTEAIQDKKNYKHREGALFAFEMLCQMLGRLFEPYIVHVLPHLLLCFGDSSQYVRNATDDCARIVMSKLSGHGVKLVLPSLLAALEEDSWRTKTGSVELLGAMAYCAPKQLSSCLPSIVPKLIEVLSDSHMKVQEAGAEALKVIGSVIRNPEIQAIVPVLLHALQDPSHKTSTCLQTLLDTQFVHFIDAPSLALIMPVVQRAFMDRSTETRKMAAQIIGNMYSLTDQKDLTPYLPTIIPGLKTSLLDPVPEVRSVSARALGAMVRGMGESSFEDLLPWLMQTLTSESSSVDRSGAAQGLSEVVGGLGVEKLNKLMPEIIATAERTDIAPHVKDGYIMMFIYMPVVFQQDFTQYIGQIINPILKALADENEYVRDTALKAGQRIVNLYADSAILLLLPELERGLFDDNWRIRYSSVQLLGDLLYRISGVTGKMSTETASEDDNFGTEQSHQAIITSLGAERRNRVLAGLYMGRSDVALMVRQAALHVWKVVVTNTPRTLREILPTLFSLLLGCLASESYDKRQVAARTLGDLVRKLGERVLPEIIPILERGLQSDQSDQRQGVCIGLSEIMSSTSKEMVLTFVNSLVPTVRKALCDPLPEVRQAAAKTFDSLHSTVGSRALDDILPAMLHQLNNDDALLVEWTLDGLRQVMAIKSRVVLPYLVPQLTSAPANTKALAILASVAGEALNKYLPKILPALQLALASSKGTPEESHQLEYCQAVVLSVTDEAGIRIVVDSLLENTRTANVDQRRAAVTLLCGFCANSRAQYVAHVPQLYRGLIHLCIDTDRDVLQMAWEALNAVTKTLEPKQQATYVSDVRLAVRFAVSDMKSASDLPGFCLPKGIAPILPVFREAILNGDGDEKEAAAQGLGEVIRVTSAEALQPSVISITGPMIRILGDRFGASVKAAVLETLAILLAKVGVMVKQFLPQLQTTFVKALTDPSRVVRLKSASALSHLILIHQRADPLFNELHNTIKNTDDSSIRDTTLHALRGIISPGGDKMTEPVRKQVHNTLLNLLAHADDTTRNCAAGCLGALLKWLSPEQQASTLTDHLLNDDASIDGTLRQGRAVALSIALKESPQLLWNDRHQAQLIRTLLSQLAADRVAVTQTGIRSCAYLLQHLLLTGDKIPHTLLVPFVKTMNSGSNDVKQLIAKVSIYLARHVPPAKMAPELLKLLLPTLVNGTKEKNGYVKANSEIALIAVLRLKEGDEAYQQVCLNVLDIGARESLSDVISKVLRKIMHQPEGKEEELDDTLLT